MRRSSLISVLGALLVVATATPARAQLPGGEVQVTEALVGEGQVAETLGIDLNLLPGSPTKTLLKPVSMTLTGQLIDYRCYMLFGYDAEPGSKYAKCTLRGVPKGDRIALITANKTVYFVRGGYTQAGNAQIKRYIDAIVRVTGTVGQVDAQAYFWLADPPPTNDTRRNPTKGDEVSEDTTKRGDYREGDPKELWWFWIEPAGNPTIIK
jgi:hypothetical protein